MHAGQSRARHKLTQLQEQGVPQAGRAHSGSKVRKKISEKAQMTKITVLHQQKQSPAALLTVSASAATEH